MKIKIIAINKLKDKNIRAIGDEYSKRLPWKLDVVEIQPKNNSNANLQKEDEGKLILDKVKESDYVIAMSEDGKQFDSEQFAKIIENNALNNPQSSICFVIGGADGLSDNVKKRANLPLSLGKMTYPHMLARMLLIEQLYRSWTIIEGRAYHK